MMDWLRSSSARAFDMHDDVPQRVDAILQQAIDRRASDVHVEPSADATEIRLRVDGLLETIANEEPAIGRAIVIRLMVMAQLLTYRQDIPQEGRISLPIEGQAQAMELRLAVMPTIHGLRAAVRMPAELVQPRTLDALALPPQVMQGLEQFIRSDAGMLIITGPAGSGKTTTAYALLEQIARSAPGISIVALEDPVERDLPGVTQIEVSPFGQLTCERALRSILRQDPQVLMLGEIRDSATATLALQAAFSGHRLICTFHASSPATAIARLLEMGIEPYQLTSALFGVMTQRLLRRTSARGYCGRVPVAQLARMTEPIRRAVLERADADTLLQIMHRQADFESLASAARQLVERGITDDAELVRAGLGEAT